MLLKDLKELKPDLWVFDSDGTLYSNTKEIESAFTRLAIKFITNHYNIPEKEAIDKRKKLLKKHKTEYTLVALKKEKVDADHFIKETYLSLNPHQFGINKNEILYQTLLSLGGKKFVLSNNPSEFAELILESLGIRSLFSKIIGMRELNFIQKPKRKAFRILEAYLKNNKKVVFVDDELENIMAAKKIGCTTVLVRAQQSEQKVPDYWVYSLV